MNILFVCTGNTCRSAMAAAIMDKIAVENDLDVFIEYLPRTVKVQVKMRLKHL